jgi:hypothetical protein
MVPGAMEESLERQVAMVSHCNTDWYADQFSQDSQSYSPCMHRNIVVDSSGSRRFVESEVTDDIKVRCLCMDCGMFLTEAGDSGTWHEESLEESPDQQLGDDFEEIGLAEREEVKEWQ